MIAEKALSAISALKKVQINQVPIDTKSQIASLQNQVDSWRIKAIEYEEKNAALQKTVNVLKAKYEPWTNAPVSQQEVDEIEYNALPSGNLWVDEPTIDILILYSEKTGSTSGPMLAETIKSLDPETKVDSLSFPNATKVNFTFSAENCEKLVASSKVVVFMITKDSLFLDTMIFGLKCAQLYLIPIVLVHDLGSCLFPNPATAPQAWQDSKLFDDKAYTFLSNYASKVAKEVHEKFNELRKGADFGLVCSESTNCKEFFENFNVITTSNIVIEKSFDPNILKKGVRSAISFIVMVDTELLTKCEEGFIFLLKAIGQGRKRAYFVYSKEQHSQILEFFRNNSKNSGWVARKYLDDLNNAFYAYCKVKAINNSSFIDFETNYVMFAVSNPRDDEFDVVADSFGTRYYVYPVTSGKWYYEVKILFDDRAQIGWTYTRQFSPTLFKGVGDDNASWSYDGDRLQAWNREIKYYGLKWKCGDIVGCLVDMDNETMEFTLNGINMGVAFSKFKIPGAQLYPALSLVEGKRAIVNFGQRQFMYGTEPISRGYSGLFVSPINTQFVHEITPKLSDEILLREGTKNYDQRLENLTTHAFLSHKRTSAQGVAGRIYTELAKDYSLFLDSEAKFNLHNLQLIVKHTALFIFILSEGILDSYWCLEELRSALTNKRRILVLRLFDFRMPEVWPQGTEDLKEVIEKAETIIYMAEFFTECIEKIKSFMGPTTTVTKCVEEELKFSELTEREIRTDTVDENTTLTINCSHMDKIKTTPELFWKTIAEFYCCKSIQNLTTLFYVNADGLSDEALICIRDMCPNLKRLTIYTNSSEVTAEGFIQLIGGLSKLQILDVKGADFDYTDHEEALFNTLSKNCPNLETLKIDILIKGGCFKPLPKLKIFINPGSECDTEAIVKIAQGCPLLEQLYLGKCTEFQEEAAKALSQCKKLLTLKFPQSNLDGMAVNQILKLCPQLTFFALAQPDEPESITDVSVEEISLKSLTRFVLEGHFTDDAVESIAKGFPNLEVLKITSPNITDDGIAYISKHCPNIQKFVLRAPEITDKALFSLADGCKKLAELTIKEAPKVTEAGLVKLAQNCKFLGELSIYKDADAKELIEISWENYVKVKNEYLPPYNDKPENFVASVKDLVTISPSKSEYEDSDIIAAKIGHIYPISNQKVANLNLFLDPDSKENIVTHEHDDYEDDYFWIGIAVEQARICPSHYALKPPSDDNANLRPRNWEFQGSTSRHAKYHMESSWETLKEHEEDDSLKTPQVYELENVKKLYRAFRIKTTDKNLAGTEILALGAGFKIWGSVAKDSEEEEKFVAGQTKEFPLNSARKGIMAYLNKYPAVDICSSSRDDAVYLSRCMDTISIGGQEIKPPCVPDVFYDEDSDSEDEDSSENSSDEESEDDEEEEEEKNKDDSSEDEAKSESDSDDDKDSKSNSEDDKSESSSEDEEKDDKKESSSEAEEKDENEEEQKPWIAFDFQNKRVKPTNYTLQYNCQLKICPKQWELQGSNYPIAFDSGEHWETISVHNEEKYWDKKDFAVNAKKAYRLFRIQLTGDTFSPEHKNVLSFTGFDLYGTLINKKQ